MVGIELTTLVLIKAKLIKVQLIKTDVTNPLETTTFSGRKYCMSNNLMNLLRGGRLSPPFFFAHAKVTLNF